MKLRTSLTVLVVYAVFTGSLKAQVIKNQKEVDRLANYINCALTEEYIYKIHFTIVDKRKSARSSFTADLEPFFDKNTFENPKEYQELVDTLIKYHFEDVKNDFLDKLAINKKLVSIGNDSILVKKLLNTKQFSQTTQDSLANKVTFLSQKITQKIGKVKTPVNPPVIVEGKGTSDTKKSKPLGGTGEATYILGNLILIIISLVAAGALVMAFMAYHSAAKLVRRYESVANDREKYRDKVSFQLNSLDRKLRSLESEMIALREQKKAPLQPLNDPEPALTYVPPVVKPVSSPWLYLSNFSEDGSFDRNLLKKEFSPNTTMYRVKIDLYDKTVAEFEFCGEEASLRDAVSNPDKYLKPLCRINPRTDYSSVKRIITEKPGKAELRGDRWIVEYENKAIITLL